MCFSQLKIKLVSFKKERCCHGQSKGNNLILPMDTLNVNTVPKLVHSNVWGRAVPYWKVRKREENKKRGKSIKCLKKRQEKGFNPTLAKQLVITGNQC